MNVEERQELAVGAGVISAVLMFLAFGCGESMGPHEEVVRELAWLDEGASDSLQVEVPESVERDAPFKVTFMTYGGGDCTSPDAFEVETTVRGLEAGIVPYQLRPLLPGVNCPDHGWFKEREVTLRFEQRGQAEILLRGRRLAGGDTTELALTYQVDVVDGH